MIWVTRLAVFLTKNVDRCDTWVWWPVPVDALPIKHHQSRNSSPIWPLQFQRVIWVVLLVVQESAPYLNTACLTIGLLPDTVLDHLWSTLPSLHYRNTCYGGIHQRSSHGGVYASTRFTSFSRFLLCKYSSLCSYTEYSPPYNITWLFGHPVLSLAMLLETYNFFIKINLNSIRKDMSGRQYLLLRNASAGFQALANDSLHEILNKFISLWHPDSWMVKVHNTYSSELPVSLPNNFD